MNRNINMNMNFVNNINNYIEHNGDKYGVMNIKYKDYNLPVLMDYKDYVVINQMKKKWKCNNNGFVFCNHIINDIPKDIFLHEIIMLFRHKENELKKKDKPILHINRIGLDNRRCNLIYDIVNKETNKNIKKKERTIILPDCDIEPNEIPTYIWYMKPDKGHGDRFVVNIGDINWKTTSSKNLSLRYKLEEAKLFLRELLKARPDLYGEYCMNGEYTKEGKQLLINYYDIVQKAGFNNIKRFVPNNKTFEMLKLNKNLSDDELILLNERKKLIRSDFNKEK